jgi:predicted GH43/DUF377 family glycosyl hydrolase
MEPKKSKYQLVVIATVAILLGACTAPSSSEQTTKDWMLTPFVKADDHNPILTPGANEFLCPIRNEKVKWDEKDVFNPAAVVRDGKVYLLFRAEDVVGKYAGTSRLGLAVSDDGLSFNKLPEPVFYPDNDSMKIYEWEGGVEDPRVVESEDGRYIMTYTAYDGQLARLCLATSPDLKAWKKHGLVLGNRFKDQWSKSGAIVARREGERILATKVNGRYWMYFGDTDLFIASSEDLIQWTPELQNDSLTPVLQPRPGYFDSRLVESGPYALTTEKGIVLLYNGMNLDGDGKDPNLAAGAYSAGQALFDSNDPTKLIDRTENFFLTPDKDYETTGQVSRVVFIEGMVPFKGKWYLYYGTADSKIAAAVKAEL